MIFDVKWQWLDYPYHLQRIPKNWMLVKIGFFRLQSKHHIDTKFPKTEIPKLNGKLIEWLSFWDQFFAVVDSKTNILDVIKFFYLKGVLSKDVQYSIRGLLITNGNFRVALKSLRENKF